MGIHSKISLQDKQAAVDAYRALNDNPVLQAVRREKRWFVGAVYYNPGDENYDHLVYELKRMVDLGFNVVRYHLPFPAEVEPGRFDFSRYDLWMAAAADAGIYVQPGLDIRGLENISLDLLTRFGITVNEYEHELSPTDARIQAMMHALIVPVVERYKDNPFLHSWTPFGEPHVGSGDLGSEGEIQQFTAWLRNMYVTIEKLDQAWTIHPVQGRTRVPSFEAAARIPRAKSNTDVAIDSLVRSYGFMRDLMRFKADKEIALTRMIIDIIREADPGHPIGTGAHMLFNNQPAAYWDLGEWARLGDLFFSSIHLSWHFDMLEGEFDRPAYIQAALTHDYFKGGWTAPFEYTGGAVQYSGGYGVGMTPGLMRRQMLMALAAGNMGMTFWAWNQRPGGWEAGEYGLTTLSGAISSWAREAGQVAKRVKEYHDELWESETNPIAGILMSWDTDAILSLEPNRQEQGKYGTRAESIRSRIGAARALINNKIPFEHVTSQEIFEGIALNYPVIYAPYVRALSVELLEKLNEYIEKGGCVIADVQFAYEDPWGKLLPKGVDGKQDKIFGAYIDTIHDSRTNPMSFNGSSIEGFYGDVVVTRARILATFMNGAPAVTEMTYGKGHAILIGFDLAHLCWKPGNLAFESFLANLVLGSNQPGWSSDAPLAFRRSTRNADHYFFVNDGPQRTVFLKVNDRDYRAGKYVLDGKDIFLDGSMVIQLPERSGEWLRFERS